MRLDGPRVYSKTEVDGEIQRMKRSGWNHAHRSVTTGGYHIVCHAPDCRCGFCPVVHRSGYVGSVR
jgi:hypothetical protein